MKNQVAAAIEFDEPQRLDATIKAMYTLHSFFELSLGGRQRYRWIELELNHRISHDGGDSEVEYYKRAMLHWSLCNDRVKGEPTKASSIDVLIVADRHPEEFSGVMAKWMDSAVTMNDPRERMATAMFGSYGINRIVGAANMFDLLPEDRVPKKLEPDSATKDAVATCREVFKDVPDSFATQSVLSALGRVGNASLRDKVIHRANVVRSVCGDKFAEVELPCSEAVLCRNHYVHGSKASFDYGENFTEFLFLTDTLEFVFGASDLIELGWDFSRWRSAGTTLSHAFSKYVYNFPENMRRLKAVLNVAPA